MIAVNNSVWITLPVVQGDYPNYIYYIAWNGNNIPQFAEIEQWMFKTILLITIMVVEGPMERDMACGKSFLPW